MSKPILLVIAGCNGSGKSSFSRLLAAEDFEPFDYDFHYLKYYKELFDSDIRDLMAHNLAFGELQNRIGEAIISNANFCYETNFNYTPMHWPAIFKKNNFELRLIYLCLNSIEEAQKRVDIRVENGGHFVSKEEIEKRYFDGFSNLNSQFQHFTKVDLFETSIYGEPPSHILTVENFCVTQTSITPHYLKELIPEILKIS